jgi:hypothetical protein
MDQISIDVALAGGFALFLLQAIIANFNRRRVILNRTSTEENPEPPLTLHQGSCHCKRVTFGIKAAKILQPMKASSKFHFPRVQIPLHLFELLSDQSNMSLYTDNPAESGTAATGVLAFCSSCGMQVLHSLSSNPEEVEVNLECIRKNEGEKRLRETITHESLSLNREAPYYQRGMGVCPSPQLPLSFQSTMYENLYKASCDTGLGRSQSYFEPDFRLRQSANDARLLREMEWTQTYAQTRGLARVDKYGRNLPLSDSRRPYENMSNYGGSPEKNVNFVSDYGSSNITDMDSSHIYTVSQASGECNMTDCSIFTDGNSDIGTSSVSDNDDSISVLSSRITSEGDTISPVKSSIYEPSCGVKSSLDCTYDSLSVDLGSPDRMHHQLRHHLSQYLSKPRSTPKKQQKKIAPL